MAPAFKFINVVANLSAIGVRNTGGDTGRSWEFSSNWVLDLFPKRKNLDFFFEDDVYPSSVS